MEQEYTQEEINAAKMKAALEASEDLPLDVFAAVPDEDIVTLEISGQFGRVLNRVLEYLYQCEDEEVVITSAKMVSNNFEGLKQEDINTHAIALWAVSNLLANFSMNAGTQNKTKIYDRKDIMTHIFGGVRNNTPLKPLTPEEFDERKKEHAKNKIDDDIPRQDKIINHDEETKRAAKDLRNKNKKYVKTPKKHKVNLTPEQIAEKKKQNKADRDKLNPEG